MSEGGNSIPPLAEIIACRDKLREADALLSQVRGTFIFMQFMNGALITNNIIEMIADLLSYLDDMEATHKQP